LRPLFNAVADSRLPGVYRWSMLRSWKVRVLPGSVLLAVSPAVISKTPSMSAVTSR
jgi:hypothetical protein